MSDMHYTLGSDQSLAWKQINCFPPGGYGYAEPGIYATDAAECAAYNVVKSFYQIYPEVWNIDYVAKETGLKEEDIAKRLRRLYDEHLIMFVMNPNVGVYGWGLYYWVVKLKEGTDPKVKEEFITDDKVPVFILRNMPLIYHGLSHITPDRAKVNMIDCRMILPWSDNI